MTQPHPATSPEVSALIKAAEAALAAEPEQRAVVFSHAGSRYVAKRVAEKPRRLIQTLFMRWLVKRITGQALPMQTLALSDAARSMDYEAQRIQSLAAAGASVPTLAYHCPDYLLLEHCGSVVATLLESWSAETWRAELPRMAAELGSLHASGLWHGGAQIKNVTLQQGRYTRIDFEENFGEFLPLSAVQANDLILFLNSISLAGPIDEAEARQLLPQLLDAYFEVNRDPEIPRFLHNALPWFKRLAALARPLQRFSKKGIRRILILVDILTQVLQKHALKA